MSGIIGGVGSKSKIVGGGVVNTSGAITTTGAFTSVGIDDNADATAITIDSSERVGIGTNLPATYISTSYANGNVLNIKSAVNRAELTAQGAAGAVLNLIDLAGGSNDKWFRCEVTNGRASFESLNDTGSAYMHSGILSLDLGTGDTSTTGNLIIGSSGKGIMFHPHDATVSTPGSDSNLLGDYEEGTWTPSTTGTPPTVNKATYTKIGRIVQITAYLTSLSGCTGAGITGLPFNVATSTYAPTKYHSNEPYYYRYVLRADGNGTTMRFLDNNDSAVTVADATASFLVFTATYLAA